MRTPPQEAMQEGDAVEADASPHWPSLHTLASFAVICVASSTLAAYGKRAKLPLITGYILASTVTMPF